MCSIMDAINLRLVQEITDVVPPQFNAQTPMSGIIDTIGGTWTVEVPQEHGRTIDVGSYLRELDGQVAYGFEQLYSSNDGNDYAYDIRHIFVRDFDSAIELYFEFKYTTLYGREILLDCEFTHGVVKIDQ